jgi:hypothetical protein
MPINATDLAHFTGSEDFYTDAAGNQYTEGVKYVRHNDANWLVSDIQVILRVHKKVRGQEFVSVKYVPNKAGGGVVTYDDGNGNVLYKQKYDFADVRIPVSFFFSHGILMLTSEY